MLKRLVAGCMLMVILGVLVVNANTDDGLGVTFTDVKIATFICEDKGGLMELSIDEIKCFNGFIGNEADLLNYSLDKVRASI